MRSTGTGIPREKHILDIDFNKVHGTAYIDNLIKSNIGKLSSPESALLLNDSYDETYFNKTKDSVSEYYFGVMLARPEEDPTEYTQYGTLVDEYLNLNIKKYYGLTITEYLDLPFSSREMLLLKAKDVTEKLNAEADEINKNVTNKQKQVNASSFDLEEMFNV